MKVCFKFRELFGHLQRHCSINVKTFKWHIMCTVLKISNTPRFGYKGLDNVLRIKLSCCPPSAPHLGKHFFFPINFFSQHQCMFLNLCFFCQYYYVMMNLSHCSLTSTTFLNASQFLCFLVWAVVVTAITELGNGKPKFYSTPEIIAFCRNWRLPTNHVWLFSTRWWSKDPNYLA